MRGLRILPLLVVLVALCAAAPPPTSTPVIAGLGQQTASDGRYYSVVFPYSIKTSWKGSTYSDANGQRDRFTNGGRYMEVLSFANTRHFSTASASKAAEAALTQDGFKPKVGRLIDVSTQRVPVFTFSDSNGSYAEVVFILSSRIWEMALISDRAHVSQDLNDLINAARSFRVEHSATH
jgi:hypothetical protein